jgi:hypothetical protein
MDMSNLTLDAVGAALLAFLAFILRACIRFAMSAEGRAILRVLRVAGIKAARKAHAVFVAELAKARASESDGGVIITANERGLLAKAASQAFIVELNALGVLGDVIKVFGGLDKLEGELVKQMESAMKKQT